MKRKIDKNGGKGKKKGVGIALLQIPLCCKISGVNIVDIYSLL